MVGELPPAAGPEDEALEAAAMAAAAQPDPVLDPVAAAAAPVAAAATPAADAEPPPTAAAEAAEADPFGLDRLIEAEAPPPPPPPPTPEPQQPVSATWDTDTCVLMRRAALVDCLDAARGAYK